MTQNVIHGYFIDERCLMVTTYTSEVSKNEQFLVFLLDGKPYGFSLLNIEGIVGIPKIFPVKGLPDFIKGLVKVQEKFLPVVDLRFFLNKSKSRYSKHQSLILAKSPQNKTQMIIGYIVDSIIGLFDVDLSQIKAPNDSDLKKSVFFSGKVSLEGKEVNILNLDKIINNSEAVKFVK